MTVSTWILAVRGYVECMDLFVEIMSHPFTWGLLVGLVLIVWLWRSMRKDVIHLRKELERIKEEKDDLTRHLNTQLKINAKGNEVLEKQVEELKEQNENLRHNLNASQQKAGKAELRRLEVMEAAVSAMRENAPGFAPAWERAMRDAENEQEAAEGGLKKLMRKVVPSFRATPTISTQTKEIEAEVQSEKESD
ncbi:hypothetical protein Rhal01_01490 [Rubritalea halochordaticola]|uniref:Uncharacterized protein n=2 Tax=Rubritalea halochordaticola TaxID=714537 RepID=A0ABP9UY35_9BACT